MSHPQHLLRVSLSLLCVALLSASALAGEVTIKSAALGGRQTYQVWLPSGRDADSPQAERLPLIVLLHGLGGKGADWFDPKLGDLGPALNAAIARGDLPPVIVVAPDGRNGYWTDHLPRPKAAAARYGAWIDEVIEDAEARFGGSGVRAIVGASMGGHGALSRALMEPTRYAAAVSIAGALFPEPPTHRKIYKQVWGDPADPEHWQGTAPMALLAKLSAPPPLFLHCGREDKTFVPMTIEAAERLRAMGANFELALTDGGHTWTAWRSVTDRWLTWLGAHLRQAR